MNARERVIAALTFNHPDRAPRDLWALPYVSHFRRDELDELKRQYPTDFASAQTGEHDPASDGAIRVGTYTDEWGSTWEVAEAGVIGEVKIPALPDWSVLAHFQPPWQRIRERDLSGVNAQCAANERFMLSPVTARPFERVQFLRGSENTFIDIAYGTAELRALLGMVHDYYLEDIRAWCQTDVDGVVFMDDWGTNQSLLIKPETWRELFKPLYRDYCDIIHGAGKYAFFHSDGHIRTIYDDLVEIGVDAINSQLFTMDIEDLAAHFKGKITFWGEIDRQHVLPFGTPADVREAVMRVRRALDDGSGGVIAQCEWGKADPAENVRAVFEAWSE